ncbi:MAG TPA: ABC transporter permease [Anaerolineales bacterium]|nr:ABC transporter permease [Anaerolineales bacterium]
MTTSQPAAVETIPDWKRELDQVGLVRRLLKARHWYGADWWFSVTSGVLLVFIFSVAIFPGFYAPYDPRAEVAPGMIAPGGESFFFVLVSQMGGPTTLDELVGNAVSVGLVAGSQSSQVLRDAAEKRTEELSQQGQTIRIRPRIRRYDNMEQALAALRAGEVTSVVSENTAIDGLLSGTSDLIVGDSLTFASKTPFYLGTNQIGQDLFSRIIWGTRIALLVAFAAALFALAIGVPLGLVAGYWSGRLERSLTMVMDSLYSFPGLILAIAIAAVLGPGIFNIIIAIATLYVPTYYRIVRGQTLSFKQTLYVEAAHSLGARPLEILARYIFPNIIPSLVVIFSVNVADAILTEAGLAFLGLGLPPDTPDWGIDLAAGQDFMRQAWWLVTFPGVMITFVTLAFSMLGESLSEILNPRLQETM